MGEGGRFHNVPPNTSCSLLWKCSSQNCSPCLLSDDSPFSLSPVSPAGFLWMERCRIAKGNGELIEVFILRWREHAQEDVLPGMELVAWD